MAGNDPFRALWSGLVLAAGAVWGFGPLSGCAAPIAAECDRAGAGATERARFGRFEAVPRPRMGSLPFPGPLTLYTSAGRNLGEHAYEGVLAGFGEVNRGIVYTCDAGFLDVSHIRNAADMTAYLHARIRHALHAGWDCLRFRGKEPSTYAVSLAYPAGWDAMDAGERATLIEEASVRAAQRLALVVMTWHEILTWYGYKSSLVFSENGSAFGYDDGPSHALGVLIAGEVIRAGADFDRGVTDLLSNRLEELGVVETGLLHEAAMSVEGDWWAYGEPLRRFLETGLEPGGVVRPWLAPVGFCETPRPMVFEIPGLRDVLGHDLSGLMRVEIDPRVFESPKIFARLPEATNRVDVDRDFPLLIEDIRASVGVEYTRPGG